MIKEKQQAIDLVRWALEHYIKEISDIPKPKLTDPYFNEKLGVFVTLKKDGMLRGCVGVIPPSRTLENNILMSTRQSALNDRRFTQVKPEEVDELEIEISILSPLQESKLKDIEIGKHGLVVEGSGRSAIYLPQVATEIGWNFDQWLDSLCDKANLPTQYWKEKEAKFYTFTAQIINETGRV